MIVQYATSVFGFLTFSATAQLISEDLGFKLEKIQPEMFGGAKKVCLLFY